jgi:hypothetical protein
MSDNTGQAKDPSRPGAGYIVGLFLGFIPWIIYGIFSGFDWLGKGGAIGIALLVSLIAGYRDLKERFILSWGSVIFFTAAFIVIVPLGNQWVAGNMDLILHGGLAAIILIPLLFGFPFTTQYARRLTPPALWSTPGFIQVNRIMTAVWGALFIVNLLVALACHVAGISGGLLQTLVTTAVIIAGIVFTIQYPAYVMRKYRDKIPPELREDR